jgi:D-alanine-D-alanine ligase
LPKLAKACVAQGLAGVEALAGVPGTVGGSLMTNAGTPRGVIGDVVTAVDVLNPDGTISTIPKEKISFEYRHTSLVGRWIVAASLELKASVNGDAAQRLKFELESREKTQPLGTKNVGSVFRNPPNDHAARLIEAAGLKGKHIGRMRFSPKHANFIENLGGATAAEALELIHLAQRTVKEKFGVDLEPEVIVVKQFRRMGVKPIAIDVKPSILSTLKKKKIDFAFIALHGLFGEDGGIQSCLDSLKIPYNGSQVLGSALAMDKNLSKRLFVNDDVPTPPWTTVSRKEFRRNSQDAIARSKLFLAKGPVFVKPTDQGSAFGASKASTAAQLTKALKASFRVSEKALVEKFVDGRELTVGILGKRKLPVVEIIPEHAFYDFHSKYARGGSRHIVPAKISRAATRKAQRLSLKAFRALRCSGYGRVDLMMDRKRNMFVLEVNTIPGMTNTSLLPDAARAAGLSFDELVVEIVRLALRKSK